MQPPRDHVAMMQIDCEVTNTRLLHIHQASIPPSSFDGTFGGTLNRTNSKPERNSGVPSKRPVRKAKKTSSNNPAATRKSDVELDGS